MPRPRVYLLEFDRQATAQERVLGSVLTDTQEQLVREELVFLNSLLSTLQMFDASKDDVEVRCILFHFAVSFA